MQNLQAEALSDEELLAKFRSGQGVEWLDSLLGRYHTRVAKWCYRFTGDRESAADLAQDIFLRAYRNLESFRGDSRFSTWLYMVTRNHCLNEIKARATRPERSGDALDFEIEDPGQWNALADLERRESMEAMRTLIEETLSETEKRVMTLHFAEEVSLDAVTRILGLTNSSGAKAYVVSAKRKLNSAIERWKARQARRD
jgi:RNA polymerase sigma-70 factor, ECF subfamily